MQETIQVEMSAQLKRLFEYQLDAKALQPYLVDDKSMVLEKGVEVECVYQKAVLDKSYWDALVDEVIRVTSKYSTLFDVFQKHGLIVPLNEGLITAEMIVPKVYKVFRFSARQIDISRNSNIPIDVATAGMAVKMVVLGVDDLFLNSYLKHESGLEFFGLLTHPDRLVMEVRDVDCAIEDGVSQLRREGWPGPFCVIVASDLEHIPCPDYCEKVVLDKMPLNSFVVVDLSGESVRFCNGMVPSVFQWECTEFESAPFELALIVMAVQYPLFTSIDNKIGVCHCKF